MNRDDIARRQRAAARAARLVIHKGKLGDPEVDFSPVRGADAISLLTQLSRESWSLATRANEPPRSPILVQFVPRTRA